GDAHVTAEVNFGTTEAPDWQEVTNGVNEGTITVTFIIISAVDLTAPAEVETTPGATAVVAFTVTNSGSGSDTFAVEVGGESLQWNLSQSTVSLAAGASAAIEASASIPIDKVDGTVETIL